MCPGIPHGMSCFCGDAGFGLLNVEFENVDDAAEGNVVMPDGNKNEVVCGRENQNDEVIGLITLC